MLPRTSANLRVASDARVKTLRPSEQSLSLYLNKSRPSSTESWRLRAPGLSVLLRKAANGDVANKIGTYGVAILAKEHGIPFYVACPWSTIDLATASGDAIPIEQRAATEVTHHGGKQMTPHGVGIENPAFDVTRPGMSPPSLPSVAFSAPPYGEALQGPGGRRPAAN